MTKKEKDEIHSIIEELESYYNENRMISNQLSILNSRNHLLMGIGINMISINNSKLLMDKKLENTIKKLKELNK